MDIKKSKDKSDDSITYKQGNSYEEVDAGDVSPKQSATKQSFSDHKQIIIIGALILLIAVIVVIIYKCFSDDDDIVPEPSTSSTVQEIINTTDTDNNDDQEQTIISDQQTNQNGSSSSAVGNMMYTEDEKSRLRAAGYTGDDIEQLAIKGTKVEDALDSAKKERSDYLQSLYKELMPESIDGASDAYNALLENTWLGQRLRPVSKPTDEMFSTKTYRENCRYVKIPPHGGELFIKLILKNGDYVFLSLHPDEYEKMDVEGNMVIDYDAISYGKETYYFNIKEVPIE